MVYTGRFAPSPTGLLHFGSLLAALASYLDARANKGRWLLRVEDLDPPREHPGARHSFPQVLEAFGLYWDGELSLQSERLDHYQSALDKLLRQQQVYPCSCSRKQLQQRSGGNLYDGHCRRTPPDADTASAIRVACEPGAEISFQDQIQGLQATELATSSGDYVIRRKDGLFAYQIAVVVDDYLQGVTHIVRGSDLLPETAKQIWLQQLLGYPTPAYAHIPVAANAQGQKLSKQTYAKALDLDRPVSQLWDALAFLHQSPPAELRDAYPDELLKWAVANWKMESIPARMQQPLPAGANLIDQ